jgi:hypothetical protein
MTGFLKDVRPYFTACYRAHMISFGGFDLWSAESVQGMWQEVRDCVADGSMPPAAGTAGACPEGGWDDLTRAQFLQDFDAWKTDGFQP